MATSATPRQPLSPRLSNIDKPPIAQADCLDHDAGRVEDGNGNPPEWELSRQDAFEHVDGDGAAGKCGEKPDDLRSLCRCFNRDEHGSVEVSDPDGEDERTDPREVRIGIRWSLQTHQAKCELRSDPEHRASCGVGEACD